MRLTHPLLCAALLALAACQSTAQKATVTTFQPTADGFSYRATADALYPVDTPEGEAERMLWLSQYTKDNGVCPKGYTIASRRTVLKSRGLIADIVDVFYEGRCKT
ncbi:hypothetical protein D3093_11865 [Azospirillum argentinense]|uniref:Lipoprotein n=1 Tax=Azospirillum argentinense TaxID=2970906 RepID=A0A4D8PMG1_9PROT|nr:hypothetical protein [Azospirillum argentinense]QCN95899.1 hypothetical protein D3093_11865 [Azospirillum argentinense]